MPSRRAFRSPHRERIYAKFVHTRVSCSNYFGFNALKLGFREQAVLNIFIFIYLRVSVRTTRIYGFNREYDEGIRFFIIPNCCKLVKGGFLMNLKC